jgi:glycosyltransferase involved in cell wall biosynthesis
MMLVTVLLPTRNRPHLVERSIRSLLENADDPTSIEIAVAFDQDDNLSREYLDSIAWRNLVNGQSKIFETPKWGYQDLHKYYNLLAEHAAGKWLLIWNDDAIMKTQGWDSVIRDNADFVGLLHMRTENYRDKFALFPLIPRVWTEIFGCVSQSNSNDSWIQHICLEAEAIRRIDAVVFHDRADLTGNNLDSTYLNRTDQKKIYKSAEMRQLRHEWAQKLIEYRSKL